MLRACLPQLELRILRACLAQSKLWTFWACRTCAAARSCYNKREDHQPFVLAGTARSFARLLPRKTSKAKLSALLLACLSPWKNLNPIRPYHGSEWSGASVVAQLPPDWRVQAATRRKEKNGAGSAKTQHNRAKRYQTGLAHIATPCNTEMGGRTKPKPQVVTPCKSLRTKSVTYVSGMKRNPCVRNGPEIIGDPSRIRTCNPRSRNPLLYPVELWDRWRLYTIANMKNPLCRQARSEPFSAARRLS